MKRSKRQLILIICTLTFLLGLLVIQINWIVRAAKIQEAQFTHAVNMALNSVENCISLDRNMCKNMSNCFELDTVDHPFLQHVRRREWLQIDTIMKSELAYYNIDLDYEFDIIDISDSEQVMNTEYLLDKSYYTKSLEQALQMSGVMLKVKFPGKTEFIIAQIGLIFIASILLILFISASFIITLGFYIKEKTLANRIKEFINNVTHEFKTPLSNITFANNMISKNEKVISSDNLKKYTEIIKEENNKLNNQVEELLEIAVLENKGVTQDNEKFDLHGIINDAIRVIDQLVIEKGGKISTNLKAEHSFVRGGKSHLMNAVSNLLDNSIKYTIKSPEIEVDTYNQGDQLILEISDNGIGISKKDQGFIFDKFYRVSTGDVHNVKGFGIGLSFVNMVVQKINGKIDVKSTVNKGSVFRVTLPLAKE